MLVVDSRDRMATTAHLAQYPHQIMVAVVAEVPRSPLTGMVGRAVEVVAHMELVEPVEEVQEMAIKSVELEEPVELHMFQQQTLNLALVVAEAVRAMIFQARQVLEELAVLAVGQ
jgi:hypothetical protein